MSLASARGLIVVPANSNAIAGIVVNKVRQVIEDVKIELLFWTFINYPPLGKGTSHYHIMQPKRLQA